MVIAAIEHRPAAPADAVHGAREAGADALHAARERLLALRLDDQVRVVALERVVRDAEAAALARLGQRAPPLADERARRRGTPGRRGPPPFPPKLLHCRRLPANAIPASTAAPPASWSGESASPSHHQPSSAVPTGCASSATAAKVVERCASAHTIPTTRGQVRDGGRGREHRPRMRREAGERVAVPERRGGEHQRRGGARERDRARARRARGARAGSARR